MLAGDEASTAVPHVLTQQVTQITGMILTEAEAAGHAVAASMAEGPRAAAADRFLAARLARMAIAAQDAAAAAERGMPPHCDGSCAGSTRSPRPCGRC